MSGLVKKKAFPVEDVRHFLEPGPVVLISSRYQGEVDVMTLGWHTIMEFSPSLVGCMISAGNHSHQLIKESGECVINLPTSSLLDTVIGIGNSSGTEVDKFAHFGLTQESASQVKAPLIGECHASFECKVYDATLVDNFNFFVFEVVQAHAASTPNHPETLHYCGHGEFMVSGKHVTRRAQFRPGML